MFKKDSENLFGISLSDSEPFTMAFLWAGVLMVLGLISYIGLTGGSKNAGPSSRKAQQAKAMKEAFKSMDKKNDSNKKLSTGKV